MSRAIIIMAGGMGSRYGGLKQVDSFGPNNESILDYSIFDAIKAGFNKVVTPNILFSIRYLTTSTCPL